VLVAVLSGAVFYLLGLENAGVWGAAAGVLHLIPYLGPAITAGATGMAAYMQVESFGTAALVASASLAIAAAIGVFATTWMTGRLARINAAAVFVSLLFWGWLWGAAGMILSVPIVVIVKVLCGHVDRLRPLAILLEE
ncbi:MAG TPA: AI-2E family transporter, partial [Steroidobacteraceae bacterium]